MQSPTEERLHAIWKPNLLGRNKIKPPATRGKDRKRKNVDIPPSMVKMHKNWFKKVMGESTRMGCWEKATAIKRTETKAISMVWVKRTEPISTGESGGGELRVCFVVSNKGLNGTQHFAEGTGKGGRRRFEECKKNMSRPTLRIEGGGRKKADNGRK